MSPIRRTIKSVAFGLLLAISTVSVGCSDSGGDPADSATAGDTLKTVLESWKSGESSTSLEGRNPSIHVSDVDWKDGYKLLSYGTIEEGRHVGFDMNYAVKLELKSPKGKAIKKTAVYAVSTHPQLLVLRQEG